ncbi:MAG: hypothetical protein K2L69_09745 [Muribaculaceae bacterium]|nr:hypothetical protein [Muribaculaceae bacterium]MDE5934781.1 hypothetical protein [Muribaculaceae bacterium]MDE6345010.1 hypothetical protein [Muribaculaceae bacterium]MDE6609423.1 hypothetical protein [Muribaculaceae bacterium]
MENEKDTIEEVNDMPAEEITETTPEPAETTAEDEPEAVLTPNDIDRMINEAEERGYLRGRNEAVEALMNRPARQKPTDPDDDDGDDPVMILREMRRSVWD